MDTAVTNAVITKESLGNLSADAVTFFAKDVPAVALTEGERLAVLRFKTDKETKTKRSNMAIRVTKDDSDKFTSKTEHDFLNELIAEKRDSLLVRCSNGEISWDQATSHDFLVTDFFDTTRDSNGRKVTKESIAAWFAGTVAKTVEIRAITKNAQMTPATLAGVVAGYSGMFQKLTGYGIVNLFTPVQVELLKTLMISTEFAEDDAIAEYVLTRLEKITADKKEQDSLIDAI